MRDETFYIENARRTAEELSDRELQLALREDYKIYNGVREFCAKTRLRATLRINIYRQLLRERASLSLVTSSNNQASIM